jgi:hypothetical protein
MMLRMHNLYGTRPPTSEGSDEEEEDEEERKPQLELAMVPHYGGINRVRVCIVAGLLCVLWNTPQTSHHHHHHAHISPSTSSTLLTLTKVHST